MLLLGTQILDWRWLLLLAVVGTTAATWRIRQRLMGRYQVAQTVDRRLDLHDTLSTAWFLLGDAGRQGGPVAQRQLEQADAVAAGVDLSAVFPFEAQRAWALTGALLAVAFGLFAARYLVTSSLSLKQSLIPLPYTLLTEAVEKIERPFRKLAGARSPASSRLAVPDGPKSASDAHPMPGDKQEKGSAIESGKPGENGSPQKASAKGGNAQRNGAFASGKSDPSQALPSDRSAPHDANPESAKKLASNQPHGPGQAAKSNQNDSSALLDRMKEALSSLMAKMKPEESANKQSQNGRPSQDPKAGQQAAQRGSPESQTDQNSKSEEQGQEQNAQERTQGQATEKSQDARSRASNESSDNKGNEAKSGIGRQDGNKDSKAAEQLRAMGKLAEIIGKRSAAVTGDMSIETSSGQQQLKTKYTGQQGRHADLGGEVNRSEVPVDLQGYVREYMEQVRRQGDTK